MTSNNDKQSGISGPEEPKEPVQPKEPIKPKPFDLELIERGGKLPTELER